MKLKQQHIDFLYRFVARGWLHAKRDDPMEQEAVNVALRKRIVRRELSEAIPPAYALYIGRAAITYIQEMRRLAA